MQRKATMEFESPEEGTLLKIIAQEGESVPIGADIAIVGDPGEDISELIEKEQPVEISHEVVAQQAVPNEMSPAAEMPHATPSIKHKMRSTPAARMLATDNDIDITTITGTGPQGRITRTDVLCQAI